MADLPFTIDPISGTTSRAIWRGSTFALRSSLGPLDSVPFRFDRSRRDEVSEMISAEEVRSIFLPRLRPRFRPSSSANATINRAATSEASWIATACRSTG
jgi:hypothetical protein